MPTYIHKPTKPSDRTIKVPPKFSRRIAGRLRIFGFYPKGSDENSPLYKQFEQAIAAAETLEVEQKELKENPSLTDAGQSEALQQRETFTTLLKSAKQFREQVPGERETLNAKADEITGRTLEGYDVTTRLHDRMIQTYNNMSGQNKSRLFAGGLFTTQNKAMAMAVLSEPSIITGVQAEQKQTLQKTLLTPEQKIELTDVDRSLQEYRVVERAYEVAESVAAELAKISVSELNALSDETETEPHKPPPPKDDTPLSQGGVFSFNI